MRWHIFSLRGAKLKNQSFKSACMTSSASPLALQSRWYHKDRRNKRIGNRNFRYKLGRYNLKAAYVSTEGEREGEKERRWERDSQNIVTRQNPRLFHWWYIHGCFSVLYVPSNIWFLCLTRIAEDGRGAIYLKMINGSSTKPSAVSLTNSDPWLFHWQTAIRGCFTDIQTIHSCFNLKIGVPSDLWCLRLTQIAGDGSEIPDDNSS